MIPRPAYLGFRAADALARILPGFAIKPVGQVIGHIGPLLAPGRAATVRRHQARVRPELDDRGRREAVRDAFASYGEYWLESFRLPGTSPEALEAGITVDGYENVEEALDQGRGVILALPHMGSWEWAGFWLAQIKQQRVACVVETLDPPELSQWFIDLREHFGLEIIPLDSSAGTRASRALADNGVLCLLSDRDLTGTGIEVDFFGERTRLPAGPATIALRTGAPILPCVIYSEDGHHRGLAGRPLDTERRGRFREDVARITQDLAHELERLIALAPEQWHLFQPNWPSDRPDDRGNP